MGHQRSSGSSRGQLGPRQPGARAVRRASLDAPPPTIGLEPQRGAGALTRAIELHHLGGAIRRRLEACQHQRRAPAIIGQRGGIERIGDQSAITRRQHAAQRIATRGDASGWWRAGGSRSGREGRQKVGSRRDIGKAGLRHPSLRRAGRWRDGARSGLSVFEFRRQRAPGIRPGRSLPGSRCIVGRARRGRCRGRPGARRRRRDRTDGGGGR